MSLLSRLPEDRQCFIHLIADETPAPIYLVGGVVRDLLLERDSLDLDFVLEGDAITLARALIQKYGGAIVTHAPFRTATWTLDHPNASVSVVDLITARREEYPAPAVLPVVTPSHLQDDLARRDFTINAMALRLDSELIDPFDGQGDLARKQVRVLHDRSFIDDPTRMFRAVRYAERYNFSIEPHTLALFDPASVALLTPERIRHEIDLILDEPNAARMMMRLRELNLLKAIDPSLDWDSDLSRIVDSVSDSDSSAWRFDPTPARRDLIYALWLSHFEADQFFRVSDRLAFSADQRRSITSAAQLRRDLKSLAGSKPSAWTNYLDSIPLISIFVVWLETHQPALLNYAVTWRHIHPQTNGHALIARGMKPSPQFAQILNRLRNARLDGEVKTLEEEMALLDTLL
jgi:tRNA nucleotidyltransferase (CCA-adding enzyme)